jgi:hypothetical protein
MRSACVALTVVILAALRIQALAQPLGSKVGVWTRDEFLRGVDARASVEVPKCGSVHPVGGGILVRLKC